MRVNDDGLEVYPEALAPGESALKYAVDGGTPLDPYNGPFHIPITYAGSWHINWFTQSKGCRLYNINPEEHANAELYQPNDLKLDTIKANDIMVGSAKVFDVALFQQMLNGTATQLAAISGFNASSITSAFGNLQGVARDTSFLSAQVTTTPLPSITNTNTSGQTGTSQGVTGTTGPAKPLMLSPCNVQTVRCRIGQWQHGGLHRTYVPNRAITDSADTNNFYWNGHDERHDHAGSHQPANHGYSEHPAKPIHEYHSRCGGYSPNRAYLDSAQRAI